MIQTIAVEELRVGMYIHLDGGWLSHPFPLSSFRIAGTDQIATLRGLGLKQVRWSPDKTPAAADEDGAPAAAAPGVGRPTVPAALDSIAAAPDDDAQADRRHRRAWLQSQRAAAQRCERQYAEAAKVWRTVSDGITANPAQAGSTAQALTQAMVDKMLSADEVGIRLVSSGGDRAAAHALNVAVVSMLVGRALHLPAAALVDVGTGALLHDAGKIDVADRFRHAEDGFTAAETRAYRDHVAKGVLHGRRMALPPDALAVLAQHHEHADGSGFPQQLAGDGLTLGARIVAIVNRYDNLCNPASRTPALTPHEAVAMIFAQSRTRYDAAVLATFIRMMGVYPAGSLVQLTDNRYAMVIGVNSSRPLKPRVLVHEPRPGGAEGHATLVDLEAEPDIGIRRSLPPARMPTAALHALDPRPRVAYYFEPIARDAAVELAA